MKLVLRIFATAAMALLSVSAIAGPYTFTDFGTLGGRYSNASAINNLGQVVGYSWTAGNMAQRATMWDAGAVINLGALQGDSSYSSFATAINDSGQVAGYSYTNRNTAQHATLWSGSQIIDLGTLGGSDSFATGINNSGKVVGYSQTPWDRFTYHAVAWSGGSVTDLSPHAVSYSVARDINNSDQIAGLSSGSSDRVSVWSGPYGANSATLPGRFGDANAINDAGTVAGFSYTDNYQEQRATIWVAGVPTQLGILDGARWGRSQANAINNSGLIVGAATDEGFSDRATIWMGGAAIDLNLLLDSESISAGWVLTNATGINDSGWIVGNATNTKTSDTHAFLLSTNQVPEPSAMILFLTALGMIGASRRRAFMLKYKVLKPID